MLKYKINCLELLKEKGYNQGRLANEGIFGQATIHKFRKNIVVGIIELEKLCKILELQPGDIIEYVPDEIIQNASFVWNSGTTHILICSKFGTVEQHLLIVVSKCFYIRRYSILYHIVTLNAIHLFAKLNF